MIPGGGVSRKQRTEEKPRHTCCFGVIIMGDHHAKLTPGSQQPGTRTAIGAVPTCVTRGVEGPVKHGPANRRKLEATNPNSRQKSSHESQNRGSCSPLRTREGGRWSVLVGVARQQPSCAHTAAAEWYDLYRAVSTARLKQAVRSAIDRP